MSICCRWVAHDTESVERLAKWVALLEPPEPVVDSVLQNPRERLPG